MSPMRCLHQHTPEPDQQQESITSDALAGIRTILGQFPLPSCVPNIQTVHIQFARSRYQYQIYRSVHTDTHNLIRIYIPFAHPRMQDLSISEMPSELVVVVCEL